MPKDPFRSADRWIRCPSCGNLYGYNVGRGELPLCELSCLQCGYQFRSADPRRTVCRVADEDNPTLRKAKGLHPFIK